MSELLELASGLATLVLLLALYHVVALLYLLTVPRLDYEPDTQFGAGVMVVLAIASLPALENVATVTEWATRRYPDRSEQLAAWLGVIDE